MSIGYTWQSRSNLHFLYFLTFGHSGAYWMALNTLECNHLTPLRFKVLKNRNFIPRPTTDSGSIMFLVVYPSVCPSIDRVCVMRDLFI